MKKRNSLFNGLFSIGFAMVFGALVAGMFNINQAAVSGAFGLLSAAANFAPMPSGSLFATLLQAGTYQWNGKENFQALFRPRYASVKPEDLGFRIIPSVQDTLKLHFFGTLKKLLMPYGTGFQGGSGATQKIRVVSTKEFKAEVQYDKHDYDGMIWETLFQDGIDQNDVTAQQLLDAETTIFMDGVDNDINRLFWLADTAKTHGSGGTYPNGVTYSTSDPDLYYNQFDGILKQLADSDNTTLTDGEVFRVNMAATLTTDTAEDTMKALLNGCDKRLRKLKDSGLLRFYVTESFMQNYEDTLEADGTEAARMEKINGVNQLTYKGIRLIKIDIEEHLVADFGAATKNYCILSTPQNLALVLNTAGSRAETRMWFNPDENARRHRTQFKMGANYLLPELIAYAKYEA